MESMLQTIQRGARYMQVAHKKCPFCANDIGLPRRVNGIFLVGCEADDCPANPQVSGYTMAEAFAKWDARI